MAVTMTESTTDTMRKLPPDAALSLTWLPETKDREEEMTLL